VDVGGGASTLVDHLLDRGFTRVTVVDISDAALQKARQRLGSRAERVTWIQADARDLSLPHHVDLWHDRAVFHFLTAVEDQDRYLAAMRKAICPGGHVLIATFGARGPDQCSGLPVARYDVPTLARRLGPEYELLQSLEKAHHTPTGAVQEFTHGLFRCRTEKRHRREGLS
jgi:ubiquinone/menaquinone biosynthesis C-methylase UbiE